MRRLVFITQQVDPEHPALAATVPQITALAARADEVVVLADTALPEVLPANCRVKTFGARTQTVRGARFVTALAPELKRRPLGVLAHMCPIYAILAAPLARPLGIPVVLWFTHWRARRKLALAERLSTKVLTVDETSFPLPSRKVTAIGHAIDVARFSPAQQAAMRNGRIRLVALGRYSDSKRYDDVFRGVELARRDGIDVSVDIFGPTLTAEERSYRARLEPPDGVVLHDALPGSHVPGVLQEYDAFVSATRAGSADKAVLEAAAAGLPVLATTAPVDGVLRFADATGLATRLRELASLGDDERARLAERARVDVTRRHSLDSWADGVLAAL